MSSQDAASPGRMTYQMSFEIMVHMGFRTHDGTPLSKLPFFVQRFEDRRGVQCFYDIGRVANSFHF